MEVRSGKDIADKVHMMKQTKTTVFDNKLAGTMAHQVPSISFGKVKEDISKILDGFGVVKGYSEWPGYENFYFKGDMVTMFNRFIKGIRDTTKGNGSMKLKLSLQHLVQTKSDQFIQLGAFIGSLYVELTNTAKFP